MLSKMRAVGYGDVLGQVYRSYSTYKARAVTQINVRTNSFNSFNRRWSDYSVSNASKHID